ncbi:hypothetical protein CEXT_465371 [Caerostris extrusa]|uniref:Uncharacterized protein n=1 Tax=Caerostris extrusa TaxID=172846 RepID=A0AAV4PSD7_CAEEX|nr:hypothetical protein CEXT_465371 [Caerostris extrusa]
MHPQLIGHEFYHHKSEWSSVRRVWLVASSRRHFRHAILTTPSSSFRRGIIFFFGLYHSNVLSSPQRNGDVELLGYVSELQFCFEDGITERRRATSAMSVEYRTSFGKGNIHQRMHVVEH